jgi:hypothetical protein
MEVLANVKTGSYPGQRAFRDKFLFVITARSLYEKFLEM